MRKSVMFLRMIILQCVEFFFRSFDFVSFSCATVFSFFLFLLNRKSAAFFFKCHILSLSKRTFFQNLMSSMQNSSFGKSRELKKSVKIFFKIISFLFVNRLRILKVIILSLTFNSRTDLLFCVVLLSSGCSSPSLC